MTTAGPSICTPDKRSHGRVHFTRSVRVSTCNRAHGDFPTRNLSLGGLFLEGDVDARVGEPCRLEIRETGRRSSMIFIIHGTIQRKEEEGVGVRFTDMEDDSFMFLQTMILYSSDDPIQTAEHFLEGFTANAATMC